jgi:enoyl-CoA hydratase/carnithine racemase
VVTYANTYNPANAPKNLEHILYEKKGNVAYVTINRPEVRNALHTYCYQELRACWHDIQRDPSIYCAIVTGAGDKAFCAGRDVKFLAKHQAEGKRTPHEDPNDINFRWGGGGHPYDSDIEKPLIVALNGFAVGVGLTIALQCQLRVMSEDAWLGDQHTAVGRLGVPHEIYEALPRATAAYLTLCNGRLTAEQCLQQGIVNRVVPKDKVLEAAEELAAMVCAGSPLATQACVRLYRLAAAFSPEMTHYAHALDKEIAETDDGVEGALAFAQKRRPNWQLK